MPTISSFPTRRSPKVPFLLALALAAVIALAGALLLRDQGRRHREIDAQLGQQARTGAAMIAALRESTVASMRLQYEHRLGAGVVSRARLDALAKHRGARFATILDASGRTLAASDGSPRLAGAPARDANFRLVAGSVTLAAPIGPRTLVLGLPRTEMTRLLTSALVRLPSPWPADMYAVDATGAVVSEWGAEGADPGALRLTDAQIRRAARSPLRRGHAATATAPIAGTRWSFAIRAPRATTDAAVTGAALVLPWALLVAVSLAAAFVFALVLRSRRAAAALAVEKERATAVLTVLNDGYLFVRAGRVIDVNDRLCQLIGLDRSALLGVSEGHPLVAAITATGALATRPGDEVHGVLTHADGSPVEVAITTRATPGSPGLVSVVRDIASQKRTERRLSRLASTDALTGLANRGAFDVALAQQVEQASAQNLPLSLVVIDVDHFKMVNDQYGHPVGDRVLAEVGRRLAGAVRDGDVIARIGGEEFAWLMPGLGPDAALRNAQRARAAVGDTPFAVTGRLTVSAGAATLGGETPLELYAAADGALLRAKRGGRDRAVSADLHVAAAALQPLAV